MTTNSPGSSAREIHGLQAEHTLRFTVNFNDAGVSAGVPKQTLPAGAIITGTDVFVQTPFNAGTTNVLTAGINAAAFNNLVAAADVDETTAALTQNVKPTGTALGPLSTDVQVFALYTQTGTAASAGRAHVIVKYVPNNDPNL